MESSKQLANRFREVILNGNWIANTNYYNLIANVNWQEATTKIDSLNTILSLTFHVNYYIGGILYVFEGGTLEIKDKFSFDYSHIKTETDWENLLNDLWNNAKKFADYVEQMSSKKLDSIFEDEKYGTYRRNIEGIIEHSYYHLGQISLIKKMIKVYNG
jgi:uncharacterized damage-inducible protein DinB